MENLLSQFFLAPTTTPGTLSVGQQLGQNTDTANFDAFLEKATQIGQESDPNTALLNNLSPEQLQALSMLYAQLQNQSTEIQPQPLTISATPFETNIVATQIPSEQPIVQNLTTEQLNFLQHVTALSQSALQEGKQLNNTSPQQALADKIFQIIEGQSVPQNISVQATNSGSTESIKIATTPQASTNLTAAVASVTDPKVKPENTKAEFSATSSLVSPKMDKEGTAAVKVVATTPPPNSNLTEGRSLGTPTTTTSIGQESSEPSSIFSQLFATTTSNASQSTLQGQTPVMLPSGRLIYDDQVLQQFSNQIRINTTDLQQKINIRLNPAELGELKIDLTMKEGGVRVNVLAHSQQAQEILERNMPKLRNVLEKQGLSVEGITVTQATSDLSDFGHFHDQLTQDQSRQQQGQNSSSSQTSSPALDTESPEEIVEITSTSTDNDSNTVNLVA